MSEMLVKLDENMAQTHVELLQQYGYESDKVTDEGLSGADDEVVWSKYVLKNAFYYS